jgi:hypothetical protein
VRAFLKFTALLLALAAIGAAVWFAYDRYEHRFVRSDADMVKLLPPGEELTTFYIGFAALRQGGLLHLLTGITPAATEKDYADFIAATGFDYTRDLDALVGAVNDNNETFFVLRGRFDWPKLRQFALAHGGACQDDACRAPGTKPHRWVNFVRIQSDTAALAISQSESGADILRPPGRRLQELPVGDPVWLRVSPSLMKDPTGLPRPLQIFAIVLQPAESVLLSAGRAEHSDEAFTVQLEAAFPNAPSADTTCKQLQLQTRMLRLELARENQSPNPADLTGLLTAGSFQVGNARLFGSWPVRKELLKALQ